ncbi:MAG: hypothetical protein C0467_22720 [Planctomycetaceae bacterium]|nr:hypothetical protein [Planctomycetaceae bacterium]
MTSPTKQQMWVLCPACGDRHTNHRVLHEKVEHIIDGPDGCPVADEFHRFVECMGCESRQYAITRMQIEGLEHWEREENTLKLFGPGQNESHTSGKKSKDRFDDEDDLIPAPVMQMYQETCQAIRANIRTLAAGGLRATVEAICMNKGITGGTLEKKIEKLEERGFVTKSQGELLHEERFLGNAALHEIEKPSAHDLIDGLHIIESIIDTTYVAPAKAARLKKKREAKKTSPKSAGG